MNAEVKTTFYHDCVSISRCRCCESRVDQIALERKQLLCMYDALEVHHRTYRLSTVDMKILTDEFHYHRVQEHPVRPTMVGLLVKK